MVKRDIVEDGDAGLEQRNRAVAFVHFADEELAIADPGAGKRRLRIKEVFHIRAIHDGWILAGAVQNPAEHPDRGGLAARAGDADARAGGVEELGKKLRAGGDGGADMTRGLHIGDRLLNGSGRDQGLAGPGNAATILGMEQHAARTQKIKPFGMAPLWKRSAMTLTHPAPRQDNQIERVHAAAADAAKKVLSRRGHGGLKHVWILCADRAALRQTAPVT